MAEAVLVAGRDYPGSYREFVEMFPDSAACATYLERVLGEFVVLPPTTTVWMILPLTAASPTLHGHERSTGTPRDFILACVREIKAILPRSSIEARMDSAFFSDDIVRVLDAEGVEFTISVPFERFAALKGLIENRKRWRHLNGQWSFFETNWKPESWKDRYRFVFVRSENRKQYKGAVQLDLFIPYEYGYDFKVIVTNKRTLCKKRR